MGRFVSFELYFSAAVVFNSIRPLCFPWFSQKLRATGADYPEMARHCIDGETGSSLDSAETTSLLQIAAKYVSHLLLKNVGVWMNCITYQEADNTHQSALITAMQYCNVPIIRIFIKFGT